MGEVHRLNRGGSPQLAAASAAYLATLAGPEQRNTRRAYASTLRALAAELAPPGTAFAVAGLDAEENVERLTAWFNSRWSERAALPITGTWTRCAPPPRSGWPRGG